ncbi:uncharacterized protein LOC124930591 [Impatiens glandulifera]|uniref:uncharacterized protein LOC124930591 n=1 Tax=Impatiens glandulifera TaxID=253017 RepID=UPI001FB15270|nr:uncharacterized protein LOC124930591 [Impatiens glandulifera]
MGSSSGFGSMISANYSVPILSGDNFKNWKESILIHLGCMDLDLALRIDQHAPLTDVSTTDQRQMFEKWERSNRLSLMIIKKSIPEIFRGTISDDITKAEEFLIEIEKRFTKSDKAKMSTFLKSLITMRYLGKVNINEYILNMSNVISKTESTQVRPFRGHVSHIGPALTSCSIRSVQKEERMKHKRTEEIHMIETSKYVDDNKRKFKAVKIETAKAPVPAPQARPMEKSCFFCKKTGHEKKDCASYHNWCVKKGTILTLGCLSHRSPIDAERHIYFGNGESVEVEAIGNFKLLLSTEHFLELKDTFIIPSFRQNLVSISYLDKFGYYCSFGNNEVTLSLNSNLVGFSTFMLNDNLYMLDTLTSYHETLNVQTRGTKRKLNNSSLLWHKRLGHISKDRVERLIKDGVLDSIDFSDIEVCVNCIKGKQTKVKRTCAYRATEVLELIHTDICGPFSTPSWNGQQLFLIWLSLPHKGKI